MWKRRKVLGRSSSFRRRSGRLRTPRDSGRWEQGRFMLLFDFDVDEPNQFQTLYVHLASNRFSIGGDNTQQFPRAMANMARNMQIGGIVFDWGIEKQANVFLAPPSAANRDAIWWESSVLTDRLQSDGSPASLTNNAPLISTTPVTLATNTSSDQFEQQHPTRIHWRRTEYVDSTVTSLEPISDENGRSPFPGIVRVRDQRRTESLRLKLRLDDDQGLFFRIALRSVGEFPSGPHSYRWWAAGSIYYRVQF